MFSAEVLEAKSLRREGLLVQSLGKRPSHQLCCSRRKKQKQTRAEGTNKRDGFTSQHPTVIKTLTP